MEERWGEDGFDSRREIGWTGLCPDDGVAGCDLGGRGFESRPVPHFPSNPLEWGEREYRRQAGRPCVEQGWIRPEETDPSSIGRRLRAR